MHPLPPGNSNLASYVSSKSLACKTPLPPGISNDLHLRGRGMDTFWNHAFSDSAVNSRKHLHLRFTICTLVFTSAYENKSLFRFFKPIEIRILRFPVPLRAKPIDCNPNDPRPKVNRSDL